MTKVIQSLLFISMLVISSLQLYAQTIPVDSLFLGQTPPGNTPKIFNLPVTSGHRACERIAITSDGKEIYYGELDNYPANSYRVRCLKYLDNKWQGPFNIFEGFTAPKLSIDDSVLYLQDKYFYTYYSKRINTGWSMPVRLFSKNMRTHYFQKTDLNNSYASSYYEGSPYYGDISRLITVDKDTVLQGLGIPVNSPVHENDFYIAADESYLFFSRNAGNGAGDIYLSFKKDNGGWTNPKKLGAPINKSGSSWEYGQFVTKDSRYLFYTSGGLTMNTYYTYWVKIDNIIDSLRHTNFAPYINYQIPNQSIKVGSVFKYTMPDSTFVDDDGNNTLTYSATQSDNNLLPSWLSFDPATRTFTGTPTGVDNMSVKVTAEDSGNVIIPCIFDITVTSVSAIERTEESLPKSLNLYQNFPNPFNPTTTINYTIPKAGNVVLKVYDVLGEEVATLVNNYKETGRYSVEFPDKGGNAKSLSSGVYFYKLISDEFSIVKKMILMK
jgi:hypothetical protein